MSDGVNVGDPRATPPDYRRNDVNAFRTGGPVARSLGPPTMAPAAGALDIQGRIETMSDAQRQAAARAAEQLTTVLIGLGHATPDPQTRLSMARHIAQRNPRMGIRPDTITLDDVSDGGLAEHVARALSLRQALAARGPDPAGPGTS